MSFDKQHVMGAEEPREATNQDSLATMARLRIERGRKEMWHQREKADDHFRIAVELLSALEASSRQEERLRTELAAVTDLFALPGENSVERFERLAAMFRKDTGFLAPGKDQPMGGADQPDGDELHAIYDGWYQGKIDRARAALEPPHAKDAADV